MYICIACMHVLFVYVLRAQLKNNLRTQLSLSIEIENQEKIMHLQCMTTFLLCVSSLFTLGSFLNLCEICTVVDTVNM